MAANGRDKAPGLVLEVLMASLLSRPLRMCDLCMQVSRKITETLNLTTHVITWLQSVICKPMHLKCVWIRN